MIAILLWQSNPTLKSRMHTNHRPPHCREGIRKLKPFVNSRTILSNRHRLGDWEHAHTIFFTSAWAQCPRIITHFFARSEKPQGDRGGGWRTWLPRRRRCKSEEVLQVLATGKRCGIHVIDGSSLRVVHGEPDGTPLFFSVRCLYPVLYSPCSSSSSASSSSFSPWTPSHPMCRAAF